MADSFEPNKLIVVDVYCAEDGIKAVWGSGNQLFLSAGNCTPMYDEESDIKRRGLFDREPLIHEVLWSTSLYNPIARKFLNETQVIFTKLQDHRPGGAFLAKGHMLKISREYRSVIKACVDDYEYHIRNCLDETEKIKLEREQTNFNLIELAWNLCEILFVEFSPPGTMMLQLLEWLKNHFTKADSRAKVALKDARPENNIEYWNAVYSFVLQGRISDARSLLAHHSSFSMESFQLVDQLLSAMPVISSLPCHSLQEFEMKWRRWQAQCVEILEENRLASERQLETICAILAGEDEVFDDLKELLGSWYCLLISRLFYKDPIISASDLQYHAQSCIDAFGGSLDLGPMDLLLRSTLELDVHEVISLSGKAFDNWWFSAHLADLLYHSGKLHDGGDGNLWSGPVMRESLLLEYASNLFSHRSLWQLGVLYLDCCPMRGRQYLELLIESVPLETDGKAEKVLKICERRKLTDLVISICRIMGVRAMSHGRLGSALSWSLRSNDSTLASTVGEKLLLGYIRDGDFTHMDLIDSLGASMLLSPKLLLLAKYREFRQLKDQGCLDQAASLLLSLLSVKITPIKFWFHLLKDAQPLLQELDKVVFDSQQTTVLMKCMEEWEADCKQSAEIDGTMREQRRSGTAVAVEDGKDVGVLRLSLSRNLARALVHEATTGAKRND